MTQQRVHSASRTTTDETVVDMPTKKDVTETTTEVKPDILDEIDAILDPDTVADEEARKRKFRDKIKSINFVGCRSTDQPAGFLVGVHTTMLCSVRCANCTCR